MANLIQLFRHNLHWYWHIALRFDSGYATRVVNYAKMFDEMGTSGLYYKCFMIVIYNSYDSGQYNKDMIQAKVSLS